MKFAVSKEALNEGLQRIQNVVSNRATLPVLANVLIETIEGRLRLTTADMEVYMRCEVDAQILKPGTTTLPVKRLSAIVRELPSGEITVETDSQNISSIQSGASFFKIYGLAHNEFPELPALGDAKEYTLRQSELKDGLRKTAYAISADETRFVLNGILFSFKENKLTLVATDGRRLALFETDVEFPQSQEGEFIVPTKAINEIIRLLGEEGDVTLRTTNNHISLELGSSVLVSKLVDGNYPNYRQVIPAETKERIALDREAFLNCVRRVSLLNNDKAGSIRLSFSKNNIDISANTPEIGEAQESIAAPYRGRDFSVAFNPEFLMDPLRHLPNDEVFLELIDEMSPGVIKIQTPFLYVLMPMRVSV
ncbi:MAG: DNA polymerase III subunit beta [Chthoniobacterales bacterium]